VTSVGRAGKADPDGPSTDEEDKAEGRELRISARQVVLEAAIRNVTTIFLNFA
jgi:hypothetical protein